MSTEENKVVIRRYLEEGINQNQPDVFDEVIAPNRVNYGAPPDLPRGPEGLRQRVAMLRKAFPDLHVTLEDMVAEGDRVTARMTVCGTHQGELMGIPPTGKSVTISGIAISRIAGGKEVEVWENWDMLGMMQQIGVVPTPGHAGR